MTTPVDITGESSITRKDELAEKVQELFQKFLEEFTQDDKKIYVDLVKELDRPERNTTTVDFKHVQEHNDELAITIVQNYYRVYPYLCRALLNFARDQKLEFTKVSYLRNKRVYVSFVNVATRYKLRELISDKIGQLLCVTGQVIRTHPVHPELCQAVFTCNDCNTVIFGVEQQFKYTQPTKCTNPACQNRLHFSLDVRKSTFVDFQKLRVQETQAELPRGSIPRSLEVILRGECVELPQPGDRCDFVGALIVVPDVAQLSVPGARAESSARHKGRDGYENDGLKGLKSLGARDLNYKLCFLACAVTPTNSAFGGQYWHEEELTPEWAKQNMKPEELQQIGDMAADRNLYTNLISSLFPAIHGNEEIKRGILLMLFGGVPKRTEEGTTLRGDINVCIVGDPSTAKSQFLKQVEGFTPRAVYTSGKASSAAGLTAAVVKDEESFEFVIEAGALMLADNGVCCIDEFDKMEPRDQVAIHEAMEQQTISITKAGVKATLNARTSILAAANPAGGRYDRSKALRQNITLSAPIMSRFDLFFILIDECNEVTDYAIAHRIVDLHRMNEQQAVQRIYKMEEIRRYITFTRLWNPKLTPPACDLLVEEYKRMRLRESTGGSMGSWRVTVRQLESMIRLSEAVARMYCTAEIEPKHVREACRLLNKSILRVEQPDVDLNEEELAENGIELENGQENGHAMEMGEENGNGADTTLSTDKARITFEEYKRIATTLIVRLRHEEDRQAGEDEAAGAGMKRSDLVAWYLNEVVDELDDEAELLARKNLVEKVLDRLIKRENVLLELGPADPNEPYDAADPFLVVHPNYVLEDE